MAIPLSPFLAEPMTYWRAGGPVLLPIAAVSIGIWYHLLNTRRVLVATVRDGDAAEACARAMEQGLAITAIEDRFRDLRGAIARALRGAVQRVARGTDAASAFEREAAGLMQPLRRDVVVLVALTAVAPLLGLLGTVMGMIDTFNAVGIAGGGTTAGVAGGVSRALITTQFGLLVALPGVFGVARLRRLAGHVESRFGECRAHLMLALRASPDGAVSAGVST